MSTSGVDFRSTLGRKFGARIEDAEQLLRLAQGMGVEVHGVAFYCGGNNTNKFLFGNAIHE